MKNKTLFIGCGGSGMKTLLRLNELMAGNPETRQVLRENISYMIFDLSVSETDNFIKKVKQQLGNAGLPFIKVVQVTRNITNLEELVRPTFDEFERRSEDPKLSEEERAVQAKRFQRLKKNWWYSPDHEPGRRAVECKSYPFRAQNITEGLNQGAGQCGPVSFLATWSYLPNLEQDVKEVVKNIQLRNTDNQTTGLNVFVVAGTAGGTGRGCWQPIAFKVGQCLREMGYNSNPVGVFFDSSCFQNVMLGSPNERLNLSVNSLTAMSELSAWMMQPVIRSFRFSLPNLRDPGILENADDYASPTDVIAVPPDGDNELSPVTNAYLIFGNNGVASLRDNDQYHEMAASALYAMVAEDKFIGPGAVNRHEAIRSFGAVTFEVPTIPIRRFMESMARSEYSKSLYAEAQPRPTEERDQKPELSELYKIDEEAERLIGKPDKKYDQVSDDEKPFLVKTGFVVDEEATLTTIEPGTATLLQRVMMNCAKKIGWTPEEKKYDVESFVQVLEEQDKDSAADAVRELFQMDGINAEAAVNEVLKKSNLVQLEEKDAWNDSYLEKALRNMVFAAFASEELTPSVGRALAVVRKLKLRFAASRKNLLGDVDHDQELSLKIDDVKCSNVDACVEAFCAGPLTLASRKKLWQKMYTKGKIEVLSEDIQKYMACALFFKVRKALADKFKKALSVLESTEKSLGLLVSGLQNVHKAFETDLCRELGISDGDVDKAYAKLFVKEDLESVLESLPKMDDPKNVYHRELRPIMKRETVEALIRSSFQVHAELIRSKLEKFVGELLRGDVYSSEEDAKEAVLKTFKELISNNVSLMGRNGADFMTSYFKFMDVLKGQKGNDNLKGNLFYWNKLLKSLKGDEDSLGEVTDRLRRFLGVSEFVKDSDNCDRISESNILDNIVGSMAGDCKPWMVLSDAAHPTFLNMIALLPEEISDERSASIVEHVQKNFSGKMLSICHRGQKAKDGDELPQDRIVVYSSMAITVQGDENPFDFIKSLDYWTNADFSRLLVKAEDKENFESYYYPILNPAAKIKWGEQRDSHGFVSPIFLTEPGLASTRWRPWKAYEEGYSVAAAREAEVMDALLFSFIGVENSLSPEVAKALSEAGWAGPVLATVPDSESLCFARKCKHNAIAWKDGFELGSTISSARRYLAGEGRKAQEKQGELFEKGKAEGTQIRQAILDELEAFRKQVAPTVGGNVLGQVTAALSNWLVARSVKDNGSDRKLWEALYALVNEKKFKLL